MAMISTVVFALFFIASSIALKRPIDEIEHVIIFMQENRAYDHYYGTLKGVRGYNDRAAVILPSGHNSFFQPINQSDLSQYMLPFRINTLTTSAACMDAPTMSYPCDVTMMNNGRFDQWNTARDPGLGMSYWTRDEFQYYYTLYDNFAAGDQYFQSTFTATNPNRLHLFSGSNGLSVGQEATLDDGEPVPGWSWETMAEICEKEGISWKVYMEQDNFDDNAFAWFAVFQNATAGNPLFDKGLVRSDDFVADFRKDIESGKLPQISWLVGPTDKSEHATNHPPAGEDLTARLLKVLQDNPEVYAKSVFILNYDEGGQFYDHHWTPTPPVNDADGKSTVTTVGEIVTDWSTPNGLGYRVPLLIVSPWTRGNIVVSQFFDHTSVIRLLENRFNFTCTNISPWRRTVVGDLTSAFDFANPDYSWPVLPDTSNYTRMANDQCLNNPYPTIPKVQSFPKQEPGVRISRALPYEFLISDSFDAASGDIQIKIENTGAAGAPFLLIDEMHNLDNSPQKYTVESQKYVTDLMNISTTISTGYQNTLHGPNGFLRIFSGIGVQSISASMSYDVPNGNVVITIKNTDKTTPKQVTIVDNAYNLGGPWVLNVTDSTTFSVNPLVSGNWYDLTASYNDSKTGALVFARRFMGRMETGKDTISDPAMGYGIPRDTGKMPESFPDLPHHLTHLTVSKVYLQKAAEQANSLIPEMSSETEKDLIKDARHYFPKKKGEL